MTAQSVHLLTGISSTLHFLVDGLCVCSLYLLAAHVTTVEFLGVFLTYNVLAFLTQPLTGFYVDKLSRRHWALLAAVVLLTLAVLAASVVISYNSLHTPGCTIAVATLLGMGNSLFHVWGGKLTALKTGNDIRDVGVFVSTGAMGLAVGIVFYSWTLLYVLLLAICILALAYLQCDRQPTATLATSEEEESGKPPYALAAILISMTAIMAFVVFRSYLGEAFSSGILRSETTILLIGAVSMAGKMAGGWIAKGLGIIRAMVIVLLAVLACLLARDTGETALFLGLFMINCTMPVTLYLANVVLKGKEGLAFGLLAAALMPGYLLAFV